MTHNRTSQLLTPHAMQHFPVPWAAAIVSADMPCMVLLPAQAQARCHRIGQSKAVKVYRLITRNSYEREMFDKASLKLGLDKAVLQDINRKGSTNGVSTQNLLQGLKKSLSLPSHSHSSLSRLLLRAVRPRIFGGEFPAVEGSPGQVSAFYRCIKETCRSSEVVGLPDLQ